MRPSWLRRHLSSVLTATAGVVVAAVVATVAITSGGYVAQRVDLGDAAVWVANAAREHVGRANTAIRELNTAVRIDGASLDVQQRGRNVIAVDTTDARADIIDPVTSAVLKTVSLPPDTSSVRMAGADVVVTAGDTGEVWIVPFAAFDTFDAEQQPTYQLGAGAAVSVSSDGHIVAYTPTSGQVRALDVAGSADQASTVATGLVMSGTDISTTSVAGHWAVLSATAGTAPRLVVDGHEVALGDTLPDDGSAVLQVPTSVATSIVGDGILVGSSRGLVRVPFDGSTPRIVLDDRQGAAAAPVAASGCVYGAWADGTAARLCSDSSRTNDRMTLDGVGSGALSFRVNGASIVLNQASTGGVWAVADEGQVIGDWDELIPADENQNPSNTGDPSENPTVEKDQKPPVAVKDEFGARPGRATTLPVLLNDYDPNADVLVVQSVTPIDETVGRLDIVSQGQQVQLTLEPSAKGSVEFDYTISDGHGGTASAHVVVTIRLPGENSPPEQRQRTRVTVGAGQQQTTSVLGDWVDPDGDPFYLASATTDGPDLVSYGPDGGVTVSTRTAGPRKETIALVVSDGTDAGSGSIALQVDAANAAPLVADPFVVQALVGQTVTISPLDHVHGGAGAIKLGAVPSRPGTTITPSYQAGTFTFESDQARTHYLSFTATDGTSTITGTVRVDVVTPPDINSTPITVPKTVFVRTLSSARVDVAGTDIDPAGGVLMVTGVDDIGATTPILAEVLAQRTVRVTLKGILTEPYTFGYDITNGLATARGTITVVQIPQPTQPQAPIARDDTATARVGDAIDIDVLANDTQPDGLDLELEPRLVQGVGADSGLAFVSGQRLRYLAPDHPGSFTAVYEVKNATGQTAQARVTIEVREKNVATDDPPVPQTVTGRVYAGQTVRIEIPLTGIDPDGDSVQLIGQSTNPQKGAVTASGSSWMEYTAGQYSAGTDEFEYAVSDALGARATGIVRIGIAPPRHSGESPIAIADEVTARPGTTVSVQVLQNDSDPDGGELHVVSATPSDQVTTATVTDDIVDITPPPQPGTYAVSYTIENSSGGTSSAYVTVTVDPEAPLSYPIADDTVLTLTDVQGRDQVDVDVLAHVFFADGDSRSLDLSLLPGYGDIARVTGSKHIVVTVGDDSRIIPFAVAHPQDPSITSYALIWVPGRNSALPQLRPDAPAIVVSSGSTATIALSDYVVAAAGRTVRLADRSTVQATHSDGSSLVADDTTLRFRPADGYAGPASISFEVTDATGSDTVDRRALLVLPITVRSPSNAPPVFTGAVLDFEPGQTKTVELDKLTDYGDGTSMSSLKYSVKAPDPAGFTYQIVGQRLTLTASASATVGTRSSITIAVADGSGQGQAGAIVLDTVRSTRPLVQPAPDVVTLPRGETTIAYPLANDEATNPFPGKALHIVRVSNLDGGALPDGVTFDRVDGGTALAITVAPYAAASDAYLQYEVSDATGDPTRDAYGTIRIRVQDVPDQPAAPARVSDTFVAGQLTLRIPTTSANNSPITGYTIVSSDGAGYSHDCGLSSICTLTDLRIGVAYRFQVVATNGIGRSPRSPESDPYTVDYLPAAPASVVASPTTAAAAPNGKSITVTWSTVPNPSPGTAVKDYQVVISGPGIAGDYTATATSPFTTTAGGQLQNAASYTVSVYARNSAPASASDWRRTSTSVRTVGPPSVPANGPTASTGQTGDVTVTWGDADPNGASGVTYWVARFSTLQSGLTCSAGTTKTNVAGPNATSPWTDTLGADGFAYYYVYVDNGLYCTVSAASNRAELRRPPGQASGTVGLPTTSSATGQFDLVADNLDATGTVDHFEYRLDGTGTWKPVVEGDLLTSPADSSHYGRATQVQYRACRDVSSLICGPPSAVLTATPVDARAHVTSCVAGSPPIIQAPGNGGNGTATYAVAYGLAGIWGPFTSTDSDAVPSLATGIRVRATVTLGGRTYVDAGYDEGNCS